jgi:hypothetical protein
VVYVKLSINHVLRSLAKEFSAVSHYYNVIVLDNSLRPGEPITAIRVEYEKKEKGGVN